MGVSDGVRRVGQRPTQVVFDDCCQVCAAGGSETRRWRTVAGRRPRRLITAKLLSVAAVTFAAAVHAGLGLGGFGSHQRWNLERAGVVDKRGGHGGAHRVTGGGKTAEKRGLLTVWCGHRQLWHLQERVEINVLATLFM